MIYRYRLPRPGQYLPVLAIVLAVLLLLPRGQPTGDAAEAGVAESAAILGSTEAAASDTPVAEAVTATSDTTAESATVKEPQPVETVRVAELEAEPEGEIEAPPVETKVASVSGVWPPAGDVSDSPPAEMDVASAPIPSPQAAAASASVPLPDATSEPAAGNLPLAHVGGSALNVRAGPSSSSARLFVLEPGEPVRVAGADGGWVRIVDAAGEGGWVYSRYLTGLGDRSARMDRTPASSTPDAPSTEGAPETVATPTPGDSPEQEPDVRYARIGSAVAARAGPSPTAPRLFVFPAGERVEIADIRGGWLHVVADSGVSGWVRFR